MKKIKIKKMWLPIALVIVVAFLGVIAVWSIQKNNSDILKEDETSIIASTSELTSTTEKKEKKTTAKATTEKQIEVETKETEATTKYVAPVTTTKKQESVTSSVTTTKTPKPTTTKPAPKPVETTKPAKPTTTKAPKDEYYPALTQADIEEIKQYTINYIRSKGQIVEPSLDWSWAGFSAIDTVPTDLSIRGDLFKRDGGVDPVEWVKNRMRERIDIHIEDWERQNGEGTIGGLYPLVKLENGYWNFTLGYC